jgi:hypothetical protein
MLAHYVARRDVCRWIARCHGLAGAIDAGLLGRHQHTLATDRRSDRRLNVQESGAHEAMMARRMMLGEIIGIIFTSFSPTNHKLSFFNAYETDDEH